MHLLTKKQELRNRQDKSYMSLEKQRQRQKVETIRPYKPQPLFNLVHSQVQGLNSQKDIYSFAETGEGPHWWTLNLSTLPGQQRRLLTIQGASMYLVNIADENFPSSINILLNEAGGFLNRLGETSHIIATLAVDGAPTAVDNGGGIIGYNVSYRLMGDGQDSIDITGIPSLTFDVTLQNTTTPVGYPLNHPISLKMQILRAIL